MFYLIITAAAIQDRQYTKRKFNLTEFYEQHDNVNSLRVEEYSLVMEIKIENIFNENKCVLHEEKHRKMDYK